MDHTSRHAGARHDRGGHQGHGSPAGNGAPAGPGDHAGHGHGGATGATWGTAAKATLHCLTGCAVGEILGMVIGTALMWDNAPTMALAITLAFLFGYSFTMFAVLRAGVSLRSAVKVALAADTVSIAVMELVDNGIIALVPGAMDAHLADALFWSSLLGGFVVAFVVTTPVNKWLIGRGKGHAVAHAYH
ncbi:DUF4396 domain-containing protein [Streptomyces sp. NPDC007883]|uniref:DUF4396 domain-containing protein n=1 Tax=Streptomyces sp. NPDC007883 TaxID=3155116 RepID=UPI0033EED2E3